MAEIAPKTVFISYSWTNQKHVDWVVELAQRLMSDGVNVKLDKWDLKEGHDRFAFMETMVRANEVDRVLVVLDKKYAEKADGREGGVGAETQIITPKIYGDIKQEKFIPIVTEMDEMGKAYLPAYLGGTFYIDMSTSADREGSYEQLLRNIYDRPSHPRPVLGKAPAYILEDTPMLYKTSTIVRSFDVQVDRNSNRINSILQDFTKEFFDNLKDFVIADDVPAYLDDVGAAAVSVLHQYQALRNDYANILDKALRSGLSFQFETFFHLLEDIPLLLAPLDSNKSSWQPFRYEHFKLIIHELFLYTVAIGIKNNDYNFLEELFYHRYLIKEGRHGARDITTFTGFWMKYDIIDEYYKKQKNNNYYSVQAEIIVSNASGIISKELVVKADMISHYIARLHGIHWFPLTYVYEDQYRRELDFFSRLVSKKYFEKVKGVLGFDTVDELKEKIIESDKENEKIGYSSGFANRIPLLSRFIKPENIGVGR